MSFANLNCEPHQQPKHVEDVCDLMSHMAHQQTQLFETYKSFLDNMSLETSLQDAQRQVEMLQMAGSQLINIQKEQIIQMLMMIHPMYIAMKAINPAVAHDSSWDLVDNEKNLKQYDVAELSCLLKCYLAKLGVQLYHIASIMSMKKDCSFKRLTQENISSTPSITPNVTIPVYPQNQEIYTHKDIDVDYYQQCKSSFVQTPNNSILQRNSTALYTQSTTVTNEHKTVRPSTSRGFLGKLCDSLCCGSVSRRQQRKKNETYRIYQQGDAHVSVLPNYASIVHPSFNTSPCRSMSMKNTYIPMKEQLPTAAPYSSENDDKCREDATSTMEHSSKDSHDLSQNSTCKTEMQGASSEPLIGFDTPANCSVMPQYCEDDYIEVNSPKINKSNENISEIDNTIAFTGSGGKGDTEVSDGIEGPNSISKSPETITSASSDENGDLPIIPPIDLSRVFNPLAV